MSESPGRTLWLALVHHPVKDRQGRAVSTSVTNLDVHDLARSARTYGLAGLAIVTPIDAQRAIVERIVGYWNEPAHAERTPGRPEALSLVRTARDVHEARLLAALPDGTSATVIGTSARPGGDRIAFARLRGLIEAHPQTPRLLLVGTGWGLADEIIEGCDAVLEPVRGPMQYNHLSVRSAVAIILDRLLGIR